MQSPRKTALQALLARYPNHELTLESLKNSAINDPDKYVQAYASEALAELSGNSANVLDFLFSNASSHFICLKVVSVHYPTHPKTIELLHDRALNDPDEQLREWAQQKLKELEEA